MDLAKIKHIHFTAIGGNGMAPLAIHCKKMGFHVTGTDKNSDLFPQLISAGIEPLNYHLENIGNPDLLVYSAAVKAENIELQDAFRKGIKAIKRSEMMGLITKCGKTIMICGSHGKSTTTIMLSDILSPLGFAAITGASSVSQNSNYYNGDSDKLIIEGDEYDRSFLKMYADEIVLLNIDNDHMDIYENIDNLKETFVELCNKISENGKIYYNYDDEHVRSVLERVSNCKKIPFGLSKLSSNRVQNIVFSNNFLEFDLFLEDKFVGRLKIKSIGNYNALNMLAAIVCAVNNGLSIDDLPKSVLNFQGVRRRSDIIYNGDIMLVDDYAHHPTELESILEVITSLKRRVIVLFQPHLFSRTREHYVMFAKALSKADKIMIAPIYPARELPDGVTTSHLIYNALTEEDRSKAMVFEDLWDSYPYIKNIMEKNDIIVSIGAGEANKVLYELKRGLDA
ncbi:MAG: UDP-N-acetylmuramate--L-alanine ligase [Candidatus Delongbacteria bacterium]|nr:UDP-N-acetylmuramate--L-alanine ligase [Candidatus Delongbacteria bacterium]MBN2836833.1 UDP-N-acetylmuramate--L-alanine ligase [Candidatus Delongbacteria bacterium]